MSGIFKKINVSDQAVTPFKAFKTWKSNNEDYVADGLNLLKARYIPSKLAISASAASGSAQNPDNSYQEIIWQSINHLYYHEEQNPAFQFGPSDKNHVRKELYESASVVHIPFLKSGEGIKAGSIKITDSKDVPNDLIIVSDQYGNLIDTGIDTGSFIAHRNCVRYYGFNEKFNTKTKAGKYKEEISGNIKDYSIYDISAEYSNVSFPPGIHLELTSSTVTGNKASFNGTSSFIRISDDFNVNPRSDEDFSITLWTEIHGTSSIEYIVSKRGEEPVDLYDPKKGITTNHTQSYTKVQYPYEITTYGGYVTASCYDGETKINLYSTSSISGSQCFIGLTRSGSNYELWINKSVHDNVTSSMNLKSDNKSNIYIGSKDQGTGFYSGSIDELRFWNKSLTGANMESLATLTYDQPGAYNNAIIGNVMHEHGILVFSSVHPKYQNIMLGSGSWDFNSVNGWNLEWKSTQTIYEYEYTCTVKQDEYNATLNSSAIKHGDSQLYKDFVTGSTWYPYVSTIGLYDDFGQLLAVGKLSRPIPKLNDIDMTFVVRFDI